MQCKEKILQDMESINFKDDVFLTHPRNRNHDYASFVIKERTVDDAIFDTTLIIGTDHPDYYGKSWLDCLKSLKRPNNLSLLRCDSNRPSILYYTDSNYRATCAHDPWTIDVINGKAYITQGNHRNIISRFLSSLELISKEQFGLDYVKYIDYDERAQKRYDKLLKWFETLPDIVKNNIIFNVSSELTSEKNNLREYTTVYKLEAGYCYYKFYDKQSQEYYNKYTSFLLFKQALFEQIRYLFNKYKYQIIILDLYVKLKNILNNQFIHIASICSIPPHLTKMI